MAPEASLPLLLGLAWLLPLASFAIIVLFGPKLGKAGILASYVATGAIVGSFLLSMVAFGIWHFRHVGARPDETLHGAVVAATPGNMHTADEGGSHDGESHSDSGHGDSKHGDSEHGDAHAGGGHGLPTTLPKSFTKDWYSLAQIGQLKLSISYYIDSLTVLMFSMVTLIASLIHFYAFGYMHDELHEIEDHEVVLSDGHHLHRHGRFYRFFQYLSLFCFSMLGLVIAGNILMVFVFWELVGICSYFLIGFYIERRSASNAANKAFIVNRVGDFGMIIGLMALWGSLGTFAFGDIKNDQGKVERGIFSSVRPPEKIYDPAATQVIAMTGGAVISGKVTAETPDSITLVSDNGDTKVILRSDIEKRGIVGGPDGKPPATVHEPFALRVPDGMVKSAAMNLIVDDSIEPTPAQVETWRNEKYGYWLLVIAGLGIFCGCVGKSAQFPLHVWLPDAMEGPTPVSALVHSATMVAAGVYLAGRFFPVFTGEVLLVIAYVGAITLFLAATIAITAVDIKRVLAYSTVSQLGYMMLGIGVGGWAAGLFHLITHAFFKSLLFMCSGSVIHATHTNDMRRMGGLRHKMPWTAYTMLVGVLAIYGAAIPFLIGFSGHYSKDSIIAQALSFWDLNPRHGAVLAGLSIAGAGITAFYMFRMWFMTFAGKPRDHHVYEHVHESPPVMYVPLVVLSVFAFAAGFPWLPFSVPKLLEQARYPGAAAAAPLLDKVVFPEEYLSHAGAFHNQAEIIITFVALGGLALAVAFYGLQLLNPDEAKKQFSPIYKLLWNKYYFDELYAAIFVRPVMFVAKIIANFDRWFIDGIIHRLAAGVKQISLLDDMIDRYFVDGLVNLVAAWTWSIGNSLRSLQTGRLRQYVMLIVIGTVALTLLVRWSVAAGS